MCTGGWCSGRCAHKGGVDRTGLDEEVSSLAPLANLMRGHVQVNRSRPFQVLQGGGFAIPTLGKVFLPRPAYSRAVVSLLARACSTPHASVQDTGGPETAHVWGKTDLYPPVILSRRYVRFSFKELKKILQGNTTKARHLKRPHRFNSTAWPRQPGLWTELVNNSCGGRLQPKMLLLLSRFVVLLFCSQSIIKYPERRKIIQL